MSQEEVQAVEGSEVGSVDTGTDSSTGSENIEQSQDGDVPQEQNVYTPNLKFKVMDQEHEFHQSLSGVIKDPETEKYFRELYEKSYGLDHVKPKYEKTRQEYDAYKAKWDPISDDIEKLKVYLGNQDYGSFFQTFGLTDEQVMEYAINKLQYYELPPEQRKQHDLQQQRNSELATLKLENSKYKKFEEQNSLQSAYQTLSSTIESPEISQVANEFDQRTGQSGSFRQAVVTYAQGVLASTGRDLSIPEAVQGFISTFGLRANAPQVPGQAASQQVPAARAKTLPGNNANGSAPVKAKVSNIQDLYNLRNKTMESGY